MTTGSPQEIPPDAPDIPHHYLYGKATKTIQYGYAFVVAYFGEHVEELTWREGRWTFKPYGPNRPLYRAEQLVKRKDAPVLIVANEDCVHAAERLLPGYVTVASAYGAARQLDGNDWTVLKGRDVIVWPDAGSFPVELVELQLSLARRVRVIDTREEPAGDNILSFVARGALGAEVVSWANKRLVSGQHYHGPVIEGPPVNELLQSATWEALFKRPARELSVEINRNGKPYATVANLAKLIRAASASLSFDEFTQEVLQRVGDQDMPWTRHQSFDLFVLLQERIPAVNRSMVEDAVLHAARRHPRHSLREYLGSLTWDGVMRLEHWLSDTTGAPRDRYTSVLGRNLLLGMIAKAYDPDDAVPFMVILEGVTRGEAQPWVQTLGGLWTGVLGSPWGHNVQANWVTLAPKLEALTARELAGLEVLTAKTVMIAAADDDRLSTKERFGIEAPKLDIAALAQMRDQLFAEAVIAYRQGNDFTRVPDRPRKARAAAPVDPWTDTVISHCRKLYEESKRTRVKNYITTVRILSDALGIQRPDQEQMHYRRIASILLKNGWIQRRDSATRYWRPLTR